MSSKKSPKKPRERQSAKSRHWKTFRKGLRPLLREKGRKQIELARTLGIEPQRITAWLREPAGPDDEERTPNVEHLLEIADFLEVSLDRVMGRPPPGYEVLKEVYGHHVGVAQALKDTLPLPPDSEGKPPRRRRKRASKPKKPKAKPKKPKRKKP